MNNIPTAWLDACIDISLEAGRRILKVYETGVEVESKKDDSPLTQADLASHHCIAEGLAQLTPDIPLLSEEGASIPYAQRAAWNRYWLIDPLDGTKEFIKRNGEFTTNIALIVNHRPILGVVHAPVLGVTWVGAAGHGAFRIIDGQRSPIRSRKVPARPTLLASRSHREGEDTDWQKRLPAFDEINKGSSLKFCYVATGEADFYLRAGPTSEWDTAAGQAVVEQAGGAVVKLPEWTALTCNEKDSLLNPHFAVIGDTAYGWQKIVSD